MKLRILNHKYKENVYLLLDFTNGPSLTTCYHATKLELDNFVYAVNNQMA